MRNIFRVTLVFYLSLLPVMFFAQESTVPTPLTSTVPDSIQARFLQQLIAFPQEKIYAQIDKPYYIAGENIWFRAHLIDAMPNIPDSTSRYIYAELIDPIDSLVTRVKVQHHNGTYYGQIPLDEEVSEGNYQLRFYTRFMENIGADLFFKRNITVGSPLSAIYHTEHTFTREDKNKFLVKVRFLINTTGESITPEKVFIKNKDGNLKGVKIEEDGSIKQSIKFSDLPKNNMLYVEYHYLDKFHKQYIPVTFDDDDYDITLFPEGGQMVEGEHNKIAFKALNKQGLGEDVTLFLINSEGDTINQYKSQHLGMGSFLYVNPNNSPFTLISRNSKGVEKQIALPASTPDSYALQTQWQKNRLIVSVRKSPSITLSDSLYLVVHCRGVVFYSEQWEKEREFLTIERDALPSGVVQVLLVDGNMNPVSERLIFNVNKAAEAKIDFTTDKPAYGKREKISGTISLSDMQDNALESNLSMSVTDDNDVRPDSCINILSALLLTSELKGHIEAPAYYFDDYSLIKEAQLDNLMLTQGWSRYNVNKVLKGEYDKPKIFVETGQEITGLARGGLLMNKKAAGYRLTIVSTDPFIYGETETDENSRFVFRNFNMPDSVRYIIQAKTKKDGSRIELTLDPETFPKLGSPLPSYWSENKNFSGYMEKADQKYTLENGMRMIFLKDVVVTAKPKERKGKSSFTSGMNRIVSQDEIQKYNARDLLSLLSRIGGGIIVSGNSVRIRANSGDPLFLVDDITYDTESVMMMTVEDIDEIEIVKDAGAALWGSRGGNGVIMITTKRGDGAVSREIPAFNIQTASPLGYQVTKEFYAPKYETRQERENSNPDLRTTIHWAPSVQTVDGKASVDFYSADSPSTYSVVIEGITTDGRVVHLVKKIERKE